MSSPNLVDEYLGGGAPASGTTASAPLKKSGGNLVDSYLSRSAPAGAVTPQGNPLAVGGNTPSSPMFARTPTTNPLINALSAGNRFTKHLVATGKLGLPDAAGEASDDARINAPFKAAGERQTSAWNSVGAPAILQPMTPEMGGLAPALIRTALDPTLFIPGKAYGAVAGAIGKGLGMGAEAARPLGRFVPQAVKDAAGAAGDVARAGKDAWGDLTHWGGDAWRKLTPEKYRDATLASNREAAMEAGEARVHAANLAEITSGLTDAQRLDAYRIAHGEADVSSNAAVNEAARKLRTHLNDKYFLKADTAGRARLAMGSPTVANARMRDVSRAAPAGKGVTPKPLDLFEQAVPEGEGAPLPRHPDLPENQRLPSTLKAINRASPAFSKTYELPENLREFAPPAKQGVLGPLEYKKHYLPGTREAPELESTERPKPYNRLFPSAPEALHQRPYTIGPGEIDEAGKSKVASMDEILARSNASTAKQTAAARLRQALGVSRGSGLSPDDPLMKLFTETPEAKGAARNVKEHIQGAMRVPADIARNALIALGMKHGLVNVPTLAGLSEPKALGSMFAEAVKTLRMSPEAKWEAQRAAREAGVLGPEFDRQNPILDFIGKVPTAARAGAGALYGGWRGQDVENQVNPRGGLGGRIAGGAAGAGLGALGGAALPSIGRGLNSLTWALDEAAKRGVYAAKVAKGMDPAKAAMETLKDTIDYAHRTPLAKGLQSWGLAPFSTFATKVPGAVLGSIKRDPRKLILADRLTGGLATQGTIDLPQLPPQANGKPAQFSMSNPLSETIGLASDPARYARTKASDTARVGATTLASLLTHGGAGSRYATYGKPLLPHTNKLGQKKLGYLLDALLQNAPMGAGREAVDSSGMGEFAPDRPISQLLGPVIGGYVR
jgi:hypothetical protein